MRLNLSRIQERLLLPLFALMAAACLLLPACSGERTDLTATQAWSLDSSSKSEL